MAEQPVRQAAPAKASPWAVFIVLVLVAVVVVSFSTVMILFFGMLPTLVAYVVDRSAGRFAVFCVGGMNACGVFPSLIDLWTGIDDVNHAIALLTDMFTLMVMYSAAAFGWLLYILIPPVVATFVTIMAERRVSQLRKEQAELVKEWGDDLVAAATGDETPAAAEPA